MKYVVTYHAAEGFAPRARELFPEHQARFLDFRARGLLLMIGPFGGEPAGDAMGIFTTRAAAEDFVRGDPFMLNGLIRDWSVREWHEALS